MKAKGAISKDEELQEVPRLPGTSMPTSDSSHSPGTVHTRFESQGLTQGLELFLFCGHNQGEVIHAEADGEADEGLLSPGHVAHQGQKAQWVALHDVGLPADQKPAGEGETSRWGERPGSSWK